MAQKIVVTLVGGIRAPSASREFDPSTTGTLSRQINQIRLDTSDEAESQASERERGALKYFDDSDFFALLRHSREHTKYMVYCQILKKIPLNTESSFAHVYIFVVV